MASLIHEKNGTHRICFAGPDKRRRTLRLGKMPKRAAQEVFHKVERLIGYQFSKSAVEPEIASWLAEVSDDIHNRLTKVGLAAQRGSAMLRSFVELYIDSRKDAKDSTVRKWRNTLDHLTRFFGDDRPLRSITAGKPMIFVSGL